jgi:hypothetical protein
VEVTLGFEPAVCGEAFRDMLSVSAPASGPYEVPLLAQCVAPKPCGPIDVSRVRHMACMCAMIVPKGKHHPDLLVHACSDVELLLYPTIFLPRTHVHCPAFCPDFNSIE